VYRTMACGKPILAIADSRSSLATFVQDHQVGYVTDPNSAEALAELVQHASHSPREVVEVGNGARRLAVSQFSRLAVTTRFAELLEQLATDSSSQ